MSKITEQEMQMALDFMQKIPFNRHIGLQVESYNEKKVVFKLPMTDELVGNWMHGILHGGVIASALDVAGGTVAMLGAYADRHELSQSERLKSLSKLGTIDMRVDYLRPGKGKEFFASATILRIGSKVAVTRMEFHNEEDDLIAVGTGTYMCG